MAGLEPGPSNDIVTMQFAPGKHMALGHFDTEKYYDHTNITLVSCHQHNSHLYSVLF